MILVAWPWLLTAAAIFAWGVFTGVALAAWWTRRLGAPESHIPSPPSHIRAVNPPPYNWKDDEEA